MHWDLVWLHCSLLHLLVVLSRIACQRPLSLWRLSSWLRFSYRLDPMFHQLLFASFTGMVETYVVAGNLIRHFRLLYVISSRDAIAKIYLIWPFPVLFWHMWFRYCIYVNIKYCCPDSCASILIQTLVWIGYLLINSVF